MPARGRIARLCAHLCCGARTVRRMFPDALLERTEQAVAEGERSHSAELRIALEASLPWQRVARGFTPRERALEVFAELGVWDTEGNNGVLIYLLVADHAIEIVADRAALAALGQPVLDEICTRLGRSLREAGAEAALLEAVAALNRRLVAAFPLPAARPGMQPGTQLGTPGTPGNELPDRPVRL